MNNEKRIMNDGIKSIFHLSPFIFQKMGTNKILSLTIIGAVILLGSVLIYKQFNRPKPKVSQGLHLDQVHNLPLSEPKESSQVAKLERNDKDKTLKPFGLAQGGQVQGDKYQFNAKLVSNTYASFVANGSNKPSYSISDESGTHSLTFTLDQEAGTPKVRDNVVEYPVSIQGIPMTMRLTTTASKVKEEFVIAKKPSDQIITKLPNNVSIPFTIDQKNLKVETKNEEIIYQDTDGTKWVLPKPTMVDSKGKEGKISLISPPVIPNPAPVISSASEKSLADARNNVSETSSEILRSAQDDKKGTLNNTLALEFDANFLKDASYPVVIDPTVVINTSSQASLFFATGPSTMRHLVRTTDGTLHAFIQVGTQTATCGGSSKSGLLYFTSADSGATWTCQAQLSTDTTNLFYASAAADTSNNIYVVYTVAANGSNTAYDVYYNKITATTWAVGAQQKLLNANDGGATEGYSYATLALEGTTRFWLAVRYFDNTNYSVKTYYSNGLSDTATVSASATLDTAGSTNSYHTPIILRLNSKIGVIWSDQTTTNYQWKFRLDSDGTDTWSSQATANTASSNTTNFTAITDSAGNIYFAATGGTVFNYFNGTVWTTTVTAVSSQAGNFTSLSTDGTNVWIFYGDNTNLNANLSGNRKLSYVKGVSPFTARDFDVSGTAVLSYHTSFDKYWSFVSSVYTDDTTDAGNTTTADTQMLTASGDIVYMGKTEKFDSVSWVLSQAGLGGTVTWEYCNTVDVNSACTNWATLTLTASAFSTFSTHGWVSFTDPADWVAAKVNTDSSAYYYVRARATVNYSQTPVGTQFMAIPQINYADVIPAPASGTIYGIWSENAASPVKVRTGSVSVTTAAAPSSTAEISPTVVTYSSVASTTTAATQISSQRHLVRTSEGTLHAFVQNGNQFDCGTSSSVSTNAQGLNWLYSTDSGTTWTCGGQLNSDTTNLMYASATTDSSDNIYVAYAVQTTGANANYDLFYRKFTKGAGSTWTMQNAQTVLDGVSPATSCTTANTGSYSYASIEAEGTTRLWLAMRCFDGTNYQISVYYSDGFGNAPTWTVSQGTLDSSTQNSSGESTPNIVRFGSKIGVVYSERLFGLRWNFRSDSDGLTSWSTSARTSVIAGFNTNVVSFSAVGTTDGKVFVSAGGNNANLFFGVWNGNAWSSPTTLTTTFKNVGSGGLQLATDGTNAWIFYGDTSGFNSQSGTGSPVGEHKLLYKMCRPPFTAQDCDATGTNVVSRHGTFNTVWLYDASADSYCDESTDGADSDSTNTVGTNCASVSDIGHSDSSGMVKAAGDIIYFGNSNKFDVVSWDVSTNADANGRVVWEYYNGSSWKQLANVISAHEDNFSDTTDQGSEGDGSLGFVPPSDWSTTAINGEGTSYYYVRARVTTAYTTAPVGVQMTNMPNISFPNVTANPASGALGLIWTENGTNTGRVRYSSISVSAAGTPANSAELSPVITTYSSLTTATQTSTQRHIRRTSDGTIHAFIQAGTQLGCGGSTNTNNNIGVIWVYSTDGGSTWTCGGQLNSSASYFASATMDSSDNLYVVYSGAGVGAGAANDVLYRKLTKGAGSTWTLEAEQTLLDGQASSTSCGTKNTGSYSYAVIEVEGTTRFWVATRCFDGTNYQVSAYYSDGLSATASLTLSNGTLDTAGTGSGAHHPAIVRYGSNIGVLYEPNLGGAINWRHRADTDGLTSWVADAATSTNFVANITAVNFSAVGMPDGKIYASSATSALLFTYFDGSSWLGTATSVTNLNNANNAATSVTTDGTNVYIAYFNGNGLSAGLGGLQGRKLVYIKGVPPFAGVNFGSEISLIPYHNTFDKVWLYDSSTYEDETTDAGNTTTNDVLHSTTSAMVKNSGDIVYFGMSKKFDAVSWDLQAGTGDTTGRIVWEYYNGTTWTQITNTTSTPTSPSTPEFGADSFMSFVPNTDWSATKVNTDSVAYYYVRARVATAFSTAPVGVQLSSIPATSWANFSPIYFNNTLRIIWSENNANVVKVRFSPQIVDTQSIVKGGVKIQGGVKFKGN